MHELAYSGKVPHLTAVMADLFICWTTYSASCVWFGSTPWTGHWVLVELCSGLLLALSDCQDGSGGVAIHFSALFHGGFVCSAQGDSRFEC